MKKKENFILSYSKRKKLLSNYEELKEYLLKTKTYNNRLLYK